MTETNKVRVLGIVGSPRRGGNTEILVDEVLAGAKEAGAETHKIILNDLTIGHCQGCNACSKDGQCKYKDDMEIINVEMRKSTAFVYGTPVYYWGPTSLFKAFFDRLLATSRLGYIKGKKLAFVVPLGGSEPVARHTVGMITDAANYRGANLIGQVVSPATGDAGEIKKKPDKMSKAFELGKKLV